MKVKQRCKYLANTRTRMLIDTVLEIQFVQKLYIIVKFFLANLALYIINIDKGIPLFIYKNTVLFNPPF